MTNKAPFASIISISFHPILWVFYLLTFITILHQSTFSSSYFMFQFLGACFLLTIAFPIALIWVLYKMKRITSIQMESRNERSLPLFIVGLSYYFVHYLFKLMILPQSFQLLFLAATFMVFICMMITFFWKISIHMLSIGATIGFVMAIGLRYEWLMPHIVLPLLLLAGLVGYSRLKLNAHTPAQVYVGFIAGFMVMLVGIFLI